MACPAFQQIQANAVALTRLGQHGLPVRHDLVALLAQLQYARRAVVNVQVAHGLKRGDGMA